MIPAAFEYTRASSVDEAVRLLNEVPDARLLAGGHSLVPLMKLRLAQPQLIVDLEPLRGELGYIRLEEGHLSIGAMTRHHDVAASDLVKVHCPGLSETAAMVGDPQVRHRGTIGGSAAHGDAAGDLPTALLALDANFVIAGPGGRRIVPARDFFRGFLTTALEQGEVLVAIEIRCRGAGTRACYTKFNRRAQDWATVGVMAIAHVERGIVDQIAVGLTHMGTTPLRAHAVESSLRGQAPTDEAIESAAALADDGTAPPNDTNASADFRRHLARVLTERTLRKVLLDTEELR